MMRVEQALAQVPGIVRVYVNLEMEMTYIEYDPQLAEIEQILTAVERTWIRPGRPTVR
jgi:copper chaperone CopZ